MASVAAQGADREIHFTDDTIETSEVFKRFLPLLISATVDVKDIQRPKNLNPLVFMTRFLVKYDCPFLMAVLGLRLKEYMSNGRSGLYTFIIGSNMGDTDLCMSALSGKTRTWSESSEPDTNSEKSPPTFNCLNPQALRFSWWSMIPAPYLYALNRAWGLVGDSPNLKTKFREVLDDVQSGYPFSLCSYVDPARSQEALMCTGQA